MARPRADLFDLGFVRSMRKDYGRGERRDDPGMRCRNGRLEVNLYSATKPIATNRTALTASLTYCELTVLSKPLGLQRSDLCWL